jgi:hypothetical protein
MHAVLDNSYTPEAICHFSPHLDCNLLKLGKEEDIEDNICIAKINWGIKK